MDNDKKLFEELLKADGITPGRITESERAAFAKMLDEQLKSKQTKPSIAWPNIWRTIMKTKIAKLAAVAVIIIAVFLSISLWDKSIPTASASQILFDAAQAALNLSSVHIKALMRTWPHDNFESIQLDHNFVPLEMWKQIDEDGVLRWRIEKSERVAVMDGEKATLLIRNSWASRGGCPDFWCFDLHWLGQLLNINGLLESELKKTQGQKDTELLMRHEEINGKEMLIVEVDTPALGDYTNDYMKNAFISDSDHSCVYYFNPETKFLEGFEIYVHTDNNDVLIFEITDIEYNPQIDEKLFVLDLPDNVIWLGHSEVLSDNENYEKMTPKETARAFFQALASKDWDEAAKFWVLSKDERVRSMFGGLEIISLGEPFQSGTFIGWFVPYKIKLVDGTIKEGCLAVRNNNAANRFEVDGGL